MIKKEIKAGDIWYVKFPFSEDTSLYKRRPCIVLDVDTLEVLALKVTTKGPKGEFDVPLVNWRKSNLTEPCYARVTDTRLLAEDAFIEKVGDITKYDLDVVVDKYISYNS